MKPLSQADRNAPDSRAKLPNQSRLPAQPEKRFRISINPKTFRLALLWLVGLTVMALALYMRLEFFRVSVNNLPTNTDEALNMLMARDISKGNFPLFFWTQPYQFPLEAYFLSLFINLLPPNAFGARVVLAFISVGASLGFCVMALRSGTWRDRWPALLLILIPSAYVLTRQVAYSIPQYALTLTFAWLMPFLFLMTQRRQSIAWPIALGISAGLSLSVHLLSLPIAVMTVAAYCWGTSFRSAIRNTILLLPAFAIGLIPYIAAMLVPNGYEKVTDTVSLAEAATRIWNPILTKIMPITVGVVGIEFPDYGRGIVCFEWLITPFVWLVIAALTFASLLRIKDWVDMIIRRQWPTFELNDIFIGAIWLTLILSSLAGFGIKYRYLLPVAWYFPFLMNFLYTRYKHAAWRIPLIAIVLLLSFVNYKTFRSLRSIWRKPDFALNTPNMPSLSPLIKHLDSQHISHCYADWWLAYRIPYETEGRINCVQPYNQRFPGWKLTPSKLQADKAMDTPYILQLDQSGGYDRRLEEELTAHSFSYESTNIESFRVCGHFRHKSNQDAILIPAEMIDISANEHANQASRLFDRNISTAWQADNQTGAAVNIRFKRPVTVLMLRIYVAAKTYPADTRPLALSSYNKDGSKEMLNPVSNSLPRHIAISRAHGMKHLIKANASSELAGHDALELIFGFEPFDATSLEIKASAPSDSGIPWIVNEIEVYGVPSN